MMVLQAGLHVPILEAKTETENSEGSGSNSQSWQGLDLKEWALARDEEATGMREVLVMGRGGQRE